MSSPAVLLETDRSSAVATITLNRPRVLNALNHELSELLQDAVCRVENDSDVRAIVIRGAGGNFMAGGDINAFHAALQHDESNRKIYFERFIGEVNDTVTRIRRMHKPVVASVAGAVAGFGFSLMNSCDLVVAADDSYFTMAYRNIGASPDGSGTYGLPRVVGTKRAMEIALLGERIDARRALDLGLINWVVSKEELEMATHSRATLLARGPTRALGRTKCLINESLGRSLSEQLQAEQDSFSACSGDEDFAIGLEAFLKKQNAEFKGC
ncbi:1,2-epoxyphenylacetyl-CoA isomerase [Achromobacter insolitus]|uniref:1,2-epoxyphenylacetyl-CoA isomerase n=2 Tax=Achromobacter insolitus TaxID=217204 RepID=A0A6S7EWC1_9BURK|nr:1,2-epoxyphenylacetyl-CoA isomerase [Achromobacter insolitus]CAB3935795.1 1,2-epoxyphenylacetyl-CoA isomerase [Achromobacter insolitus]